MGLFDKKFCDICGEKIGLMGNKKVEDGNICKNCNKKLSPWFTQRRHTPLEEIKKQLAYREDNKKKVEQFQATKVYEGSYEKLFVDQEHQWIAIGSALDEENNPDVLTFSQITSCNLDEVENRHEEKYTENGERKSYSPPRYTYKYDFYLVISVDSPWFQSMRMKLNTFEVEERRRGEIRSYEKTADAIEDLLMHSTPKASARPQRGSTTTETKATWTCPHCGTENTGKFCMNCGAQKVEAQGHLAHCSACGWTAADETMHPKFCPECGKPLQ